MPALTVAETVALPAATPEPKPDEPKFTCKYCGHPSWVHPSEQLPPVDYCHPEDHNDE